MCEDTQRGRSYELQYYLLEDREVARVKYDIEADEVFDGQIMDRRGQWAPCPAAVVACDGRPISRKKAKTRVKKVGGRLKD